MTVASSPANRRTGRANRLPDVRFQARQPIELILYLWYVCRHVIEDLCCHTEAGRHPNTLDPHQLPELRGLAADDHRLAAIDFWQAEYVRVHLHRLNRDTKSYSVSSNKDRQQHLTRRYMKYSELTGI